MPIVTVYTTSLCPYCHAAKRLLTQKAVPFEEFDVTGHMLRATPCVSRPAG